MTAHSIRSNYDVVVAGSRCSGAGLALLLARRGVRVLVVDPRRPGSDSLSTHALMRGAVAQLNRWGVLDEVRSAGTPPVRSTTFYYGSESIHIPIEARDGADALYAPRRTVLDSILAEAASSAGAHVVYGVSLTDVLRDRRGRVRGALLRTPDGRTVTVRSDVVVGADGARSRVARLVEAPFEQTAPHAAATVFGYWPEVGREGYHWYWERGVGAGAIPTNNGETCVFVAMPADRFRQELAGGLESIHQTVLRQAAPDLASDLAWARQTKLRAFAGAQGFLRRSYGPGWALVGDAGFFRDPITAHGITDALRDAELLARTIASGPEGALTSYQEARDDVARDLLMITDRIASFDWEMDDVKELHLAFSRAMGRGVDVVTSFDADTRAVA
jgi:flavin-dependent dehydrogenase